MLSSSASTNRRIFATASAEVSFLFDIFFLIFIYTEKEKKIVNKGTHESEKNINIDPISTILQKLHVKTDKIFYLSIQKMVYN